MKNLDVPQKLLDRFGIDEILIFHFIFDFLEEKQLNILSLVMKQHLCWEGLLKHFPLSLKTKNGIENKLLLFN